MTKKINRALTADEIREINDECVARSATSSTPAQEWIAVAEGDDWTLCKIDTLPDMFALLTDCGEPCILDREDVEAQLGQRDAIAAGVGPTKYTDCGEYELIAEVNDDGQRDDSINLYVGRAADGHCDLLASDNASIWVVGDADDPARNRDHWDTIEGHGLDMDAVRDVDTDLADWLDERRDEANRTVIIYRGDCLPDDPRPDDVAIAPRNDLSSATIKAVWDKLPSECILVQGLGDNSEMAHLAPFDGGGDPSKDCRTIEGYDDFGADYYVAPWDAECGDADIDTWDFYTADGDEYEEA